MSANRDLMVPTVHLNGTSGEDLESQLEEAVQTVMNAITALAEAAPNARDYYTQGPGAFGKAVAQHELRAEKLRGVRDELMAVWEAVQEQNERRSQR